MNLTLLRDFIVKYKLQFTVTLMLIGLWILFVSASPSSFLREGAIGSVTSVTALYLLLGVGLTLVITSGEIDLSYPFVMAFSAWVFATIWSATGSPILAVLACLAVGAILEMANGIIITKIGVPSIVITIATMFLYTGGVMVASGGKSMSLRWAKVTLLHNVLTGDLGFVPVQMIWAIAIAGVFWFLLNRHIIGAHILATGDNEEAARNLGVNVDRTKIIAFTITGIIAAFTGMIVTLNTLSFFPGFGAGYLLPVFAAVFIGGTSMAGGKGTIYGTVIGAIVIGSLDYGVIAMGVKGFWLDSIYGLIIVIAAAGQAIFLRR